MRERIYFLDNLKAAIIALVIVFHAALAYMIYAPSWWYVLDTNRVLSADLFVVWADMFIMPVMFFISGYFAVKSLSRESTGRFWYKKWLRIGIPWVAGSMLVAPFITYIIFASRNVPLGFSDFYWQYFWGEAYQQSQYWYLGALMALYLLLAVFGKLVPACTRKVLYPHQPTLLFFVGIVLLSALGYGAVNAYVPDGAWIHPAYLLVLQPTRIPVHIIYFALGVYAWRHNWFSWSGYQVNSAGWLFGFIAFSVIYLAFVFLLPAFYQLPSVLQLAVNALLRSLLCFYAVFGLLALFSNIFDANTPFWQKAASASYAMYWAHMMIVFLLNWLVRDMFNNAFLKFAIVAPASLLLCYLVSRYGLMYLPFFAGKKSHKIGLHINK